MILVYIIMLLQLIISKIKNDISANSKQRWSKNKCRCKCKKFIDNETCDKGFI